MFGRSRHSFLANRLSRRFNGSESSPNREAVPATPLSPSASGTSAAPNTSSTPGRRRSLGGAVLARAEQPPSPIRGASGHPLERAARPPALGGAAEVAKRAVRPTAVPPPRLAPRLAGKAVRVTALLTGR